MTSATEPYDFYGGPFSNFWTSPFEAPDPWGNPCWYVTVEHYFQAHKATSKTDHDYVNAKRRPYDAKMAGRTIVLRPGWDDGLSYEVMVTGLGYKFARPALREKLLATGEREIREDSPTDFIWGYRNNGLNLLGKALMQTRQAIREGEQ